ncbi:hypothetical protein FACS189496_3150 [Bacilli bacterium]|nr:hypothetical protein FACS189496_3150 [Bacilli bacterium]
MKNAVVLVNPSYRISHIVKLSKKYNFVPICIFTMPNNKFANFESTIPNILNLNKNVIFYKTYLEKCSIEEFAKKISLTYKINAIVPYEDDLLFSEKLAKLLNVACNDFNTIDVRKDKYKFNELLAKHNVRSAKQMMVEKNTKTKDIVKFFNNTFPIVLKPIDGAASISVYICKDEKMINEILNNSNGNAFKSKFVAQEFIGGDEYMVNFVTYKSKHFLTNICKYDRAVVDGHVLYVGLQYITKHDKL